MMKDTKTEKDKLHRYLDDLYTRDDASQLLQSIKDSENQDILDELAAEVWEESGNLQPATDLERERYKREARQLLKRIEHKKRTWFRRASVVAVSTAAVIAIIIGSVNFFRYMNEQQVTLAEITTSFGEKRQVTLPDGTLLVLNSCSQVRYPDRFVGDLREVELEGEGYFRVARNEKMPFVVRTKRLDVQVLGTRFDVKSYSTDEIVSVSVESGKVQVDLPEAMMRLTAKEQVLINTVSGEYSKKTEDRGVAVWMKGGLRFYSTPIRDVAKELERVYNCRITFAPGQDFNNLITGEHDNKSLEAVLKSIEFISGDIKYKNVNGDEVIDANDVTAIGYSTAAPEIYYSFHLGAEWKGIGVDVMFQGTGNYSAVLNTKSMFWPLINNTTLSTHYYENRWTPENQNAKYPRLSSQSNANNYQANTVWLADRSFLKLRNAEVYYRFPEEWMKKTKILGSAKLYVRGTDLFCSDHIDVTDPECYGVATPLNKSVVVGVTIGF